MTDKIIILAENDRASYRGVKRLSEAQWAIYRRDDDVTKLTLDYANLFGSATVSSVDRQSAGPILSATSNTTTQVIQSLQGHGHVDIVTTASDGQVRTDRICVLPRSEDDAWSV